MVQYLFTPCHHQNSCPPPPLQPSSLDNMGKKPIRTVSLAFASLWFLLLEAQAETLLSTESFRGCREGRLTYKRRHWPGQSTKTSAGTKYIYSTILWFSYNTYPHTPAPFPLSYFPPPKRPKARGLDGVGVLYCWTSVEGSKRCDFHCDGTVRTVCVAGDAKSRASIAIPAVVI